MHGILLRQDESAVDTIATETTDAATEAMSGIWSMLEKAPTREWNLTLSWVLALLGQLVVTSSGSSGLQWIFLGGGLSAGWYGYLWTVLYSGMVLLVVRSWWAFISLYLNQDAWTAFYFWRWGMMTQLYSVALGIAFGISAFLWGWSGSALLLALGGSITPVVSTLHQYIWGKALWYNFDSDGAEASHEFDWFALSEADDEAHAEETVSETVEETTETVEEAW